MANGRFPNSWFKGFSDLSQTFFPNNRPKARVLLSVGSRLIVAFSLQPFQCLPTAFKIGMFDLFIEFDTPGYKFDCL